MLTPRGVLAMSTEHAIIYGLLGWFLVAFVMMGLNVW
jgi:hypothetical protein